MSTAVSDVIADLTALATSGEPLAFRTGDPRPGLRDAAVLILFGEMDATLATHRGVVPATLDVLLLRRARTLRAHPGQIAFPGGAMDAGDATPAAAALREAAEETGVDPRGIEVLGTLPPLPLAFSGFLVHPVIAWWRTPSPVSVMDTAESADVFRAPVADLLNPENRRTMTHNRQGYAVTVPAFVLPDVPDAEPGRVVWGFTAGVLDAVFDRLGWTEPWDRSRSIPAV